MAETGTRLSIVVPVWNEVRLVDRVLRRVRAALPDAELIAVDDASTDGTAEALAALAADPSLRLRLERHPVNRGKGAACRTGFALATREFTVVQDADLEYDPADLPPLLARLATGDCEAVYGSRFLDGRARPLSRAHRLGNRFLTLVSNLSTGYRLTDMETCYKMLRTDWLRRITLTEDRFGFDPELTLALAGLRARLVELPVSYSARTWAEGKKIGLRDVFRVLSVLIRRGIVLAPWRFGGALAIVAAALAALVAGVWWALR